MIDQALIAQARELLDLCRSRKLKIATAESCTAGLVAGTLAVNSFSGLGNPGTGTLKVDGKEVQTNRMEHTLPAILQWDEAFDIGSDTETGVNDDDYQPSFPLTAKLNKLTIKIDRPQLSPEDIKKLEDAMKSAADAK